MIKLRIYAIAAVLLTVTGCAQLGSRFYAQFDSNYELDSTVVFFQYANTGSNGEPFELNASAIAPYRHTRRTKGRLTVEGPPSHNRLVAGLARALGRSLQDTDRVLGVASPLTATLVLLPMSPKPAEISGQLEVGPTEMVFPLVIDPSVRTLEDFLADTNFFTLGMVGHEIFEADLIGGEFELAGDPVLELRNGMKIKLRANTRWYRDGFASYASEVWREYLIAQSSAGRQPDWPASFVTDSPLENLEAVGAKLFSWHQHQAPSDTPYYSASYGLFLALENAFGRDAIRRVNSRLADAAGVLTGPRIMELVNAELGINLRSFTRRYKAPAATVSPGLPGNSPQPSPQH